MIQGFKKFIMRGNVIELAVAVVIADAFTPIVKNLVDSVINPPPREPGWQTKLQFDWPVPYRGRRSN